MVTESERGKKNTPQKFILFGAFNTSATKYTFTPLKTNLKEMQNETIMVSRTSWKG